MIIVPVSSGKDSTLCLLKALDTGEKVIPVFCETGWDHPIVYEYLEYLEDKLNIKIERIHSKRYDHILDVIKKYKTWPGGPNRPCTSEFKINSFKDWLKDNEIVNMENVEVWYGMRVHESSQRKNKYSWLRQSDRISLSELLNYPKYCNKIMAVLPILYLREKRVFIELEKYGIKRNELYNMGHKRVGCYPCFLSTEKEQIKCFSTEFGKGQYKKIKVIEEEINIKFTYGKEKGGCMICDM